MNWTPDDIFAIKNITPSTPAHVYLGALTGQDSDVHRGAWCRHEDIDLAWPAASPDGRVGDLLAVSSTARIALAPQLHGKLVALVQRQKFTHLGVVRSSASLRSVDQGNGYDEFVWVEVVALSRQGFEVDVPGVAMNQLPYLLPGGNFIPIQNIAALTQDQRSALRRNTWLGFGPIARPRPDFTATRPALRP